jgi:hypothetical protein
VDGNKRNPLIEAAKFDAYAEELLGLGFKPRTFC